MKTIKQICTFLLLAVSLVFISACGTTAVVESHPALAPPNETNPARVYFLRPDIGYPGVMGNAFSIAMEGREMLTLAKGEYTLVYIRPISGTLTVESTTVVNQSGRNVMTKAKESQSFSFEAGKTYHVAFRRNQQGWLNGGGSSYIPVLISGEEAKMAAVGLKPVGKAMQAPIIQK